jgi:hypothetical protein
VRQAITSLLDELPTPSALLDADTGRLLQLLHPLGLQAVRYSALREMSKDFLDQVGCLGSSPDLLVLPLLRHKPAMHLQQPSPHQHPCLSLL